MYYILVYDLVQRMSEINIIESHKSPQDFINIALKYYIVYNFYGIFKMLQTMRG